MVFVSPHSCDCIMLSWTIPHLQSKPNDCTQISRIESPPAWKMLSLNAIKSMWQRQVFLLDKFKTVELENISSDHAHLKADRIGSIQIFPSIYGEESLWQRCKREQITRWNLQGMSAFIASPNHEQILGRNDREDLQRPHLLWNVTAGIAMTEPAVQESGSSIKPEKLL